jgi:hypothetical protein
MMNVYTVLMGIFEVKEKLGVGGGGVRGYY